MQIVSNLHEMSKSVFWENGENILKCCQLKFYPECYRSIKEGQVIVGFETKA